MCKNWKRNSLIRMSSLRNSSKKKWIVISLKWSQKLIRNSFQKSRNLRKSHRSKWHKKKRNSTKSTIKISKTKPRPSNNSSYNKFLKNNKLSLKRSKVKKNKRLFSNKTLSKMNWRKIHERKNETSWRLIREVWAIVLGIRSWVKKRIASKRI
jgi:hypothetical protein